MAKKTKKKAKSEAPKTDDPGQRYLTRLEEAHARGNYGAVRALTQNPPGDLSDAQRAELALLMERTTLDKIPLAMGIAAAVLVIIVGLVTLSY